MSNCIISRTIKMWKNSDDHLHRNHDLPAIVFKKNYRWCIKNVENRQRGLACSIHSTGTKLWYENNSIRMLSCQGNF